MAVTNAQIIMDSMLLAGIDLDTKVDTFAGWKRNGFHVKKGEKAVFKTKIWKPFAGKVDEDETIMSQEAERVRTKLRLVNAAFFTQAQVEKGEESDIPG